MMNYEEMVEGEVNGYGVEISNVKKSFGELCVLEDINLSIRAGEFVAIVGKSGCGKSTLLRLISHLETVDDGTILIEGKEQRSLDPHIKFLFQDARLLPWKKVWKNVALMTKEKTRNEVLSILEQVGLGGHVNKWPSLLSGGQKQRVALARALAADPKLLLLDEPLGALDALTRIEMQRLIEALWEKKGFSVILVTHDVSEAVYLADKVILIEDGKITLSKEITLARPRVRDESFMYFERCILNKIMGDEEEKQQETIKNSVYSI